jgi:SAM-dependent methyltransferase
MNKTLNWSNGVDEEIKFWSRWLETKGDRWPEQYSYRTNPRAEVEGLLCLYLKNVDGIPRVLDVGAGPLTAVGKYFKGIKIDLVAVDALADKYNNLDLLEGLQVVKTQQCDTESLCKIFDESSFDICHALNTLDHSYDPIEAIKQMIAVTRVGGHIIASHAANEAINENWNGFHQWNFSSDGADLLISNKTEVFYLQKIIKDYGEIVSISPKNATWVDCVVKKIK